MVSIIPGIDTAAPERTETSSGFCFAPNCRPISRSTFAIAASTSAFNSAG